MPSDRSPLVAAAMLAVPPPSGAVAEEPVPIGTVIGVQPLTPGVDCETGAARQRAFVASDPARCSAPLDAGCLLFDGDVLTLTGVAPERRICDGPLRRIAFTNGPVRYEVAGACPGAVNGTLSVLHDLKPDAAPPANSPEDERVARPGLQTMRRALIRRLLITIKARCRSAGRVLTGCFETGGQAWRPM